SKTSGLFDRRAVPEQDSPLLEKGVHSLDAKGPKAPTPAGRKFSLFLCKRPACPPDDRFIGRRHIDEHSVSRTFGVRNPACRLHVDLSSHLYRRPLKISECKRSKVPTHGRPSANELAREGRNHSLRRSAGADFLGKIANDFDRENGRKRLGEVTKQHESV